MKLHATICYKTKPEHKYHEDGRLFVYEDTYTFYGYCDVEDTKQGIKEDITAVVTYDGAIDIIKLTIKEVK